MLALLLLAALVVGGRVWLAEHPQHDPWAPLDLRDPPGWTTQAKLRALRSDVAQCRAALERSEVAYTALPAQGEGPCAREDRTQLKDYPLSPQTPAVTCPVAVALHLWERDALQPLARELFGSELSRIEHLGAYSCRRLYGRDTGPWSEHATANAIDISAFVLEDGTRISVLRDWGDGTAKQEFLHRARDGGCSVFATTLSPDYNAAHADHFHLDMSEGWRGLCR